MCCPEVDCEGPGSPCCTPLPEIKTRVIEPGKIRPLLEVEATHHFATKQASIQYIEHQLDMGFAVSRVREGGRYRVTVMGFLFP